ncbi:ribose-phosphate diphosphokinase [Runella sp.]|uniref:ribose-phosphate diphosphokinase n=1 Tax=Runella sp. TaxID=1960881 RepID=UPI003D0EA614
MKTLDLITSENSDIQFKSFNFPDGQPHIKIDVSSLEGVESCKILTRLASMNDVFLALAAKNALEYAGVEQIELTVSYLMAARMDRVMTDGEPFSLKIVADILNLGGFKRVTIFDPHSDVSTALINRSTAIDNSLLVKAAVEDFSQRFPEQIALGHCLISPDSGALKKVYKVAQQLGIDDVAEFIKHRDVKTGHLSGFKTFEENFNQKTCFIVDDLCDGGGTFAGIASLLKSRNAGAVVLVVSHGIFSKGLSISGIDHIYTTDSYRTFSELPENFNVKKVIAFV